MKEDKQNGKKTVFYENGNVEEESFYVDDKLNGKSTTF
jgi:antitoxin component YwqK of YwqJK toxin-antitoxin module